MRWLAMADAATGDGGSEAARGGGRWRWAAMVVGGEALGGGEQRASGIGGARRLGRAGPRWARQAGAVETRRETHGGARLDEAAAELTWQALIGRGEVEARRIRRRSGKKLGFGLREKIGESHIFIGRGS